MRAPTGTALLWAGAAVACFGGALLATGAWVALPPAAVVVLAKALPFVVGGALMTVGAILRRSALLARARRADADAIPGARAQRWLDASQTPPTVPWREPPARRNAAPERAD